MTDGPQFRRLLTGLDTLEVAYFLVPVPGGVFSFTTLLAEKERLQASKSRSPAVVDLGSQSFLLRPHGTASGFPLLLENTDFSVQCGEFNNPSFFVTYRSEALWRFGAARLHESFLAWADSVGLVALRSELVSRVDFTFDYGLPTPDFHPDQIVTLSAKDDVHRQDRALQTMSFGKGEVRLRIYDKVAEIQQQSEKVWFYDLWGVREDVWRIEWQVRKEVLRRFGIRTLAGLFDAQADLLRYLATEHDTLRSPSSDSNRSRWPLHPLWADLHEQIDELQGQGIYREVDPDAVLNERLRWIAISVYGYLKRVAAITGLQKSPHAVTLAEAQNRLSALVRDIHEPQTWRLDVQRKQDNMRLGDH